jgi:hypothetical protein
MAAHLPLRYVLQWGNRAMHDRLSVFLLTALLLASVSACTSEPAGRGAPVADASIAVVEAVQGEASVLHEAGRLAAQPGMRLAAGDRLQTAEGKMRVRMRDDSILAVGSNTRLALSDLVMDEKARSGRIDVAAGRFWMHVEKWTGTGESRYEVATPSAVAGVRGTTLWGDTQVDAICALEGTIEVRSVKNTGIAPATLRDGNCAARLSEGQLAPLVPTTDQIGKYLDEVLIRTK